jgi:hypothetical protein
MNEANKLALGIAPLATLGLLGGLWFICTSIAHLVDNAEICWEAAILSAVCYGFIVVSTNQLNIHTENTNKK